MQAKHGCVTDSASAPEPLGHKQINQENQHSDLFRAPSSTPLLHRTASLCEGKSKHAKTAHDGCSVRAGA